MRIILLAALLSVTCFAYGTNRADAQIAGSTRLHIDTSVVSFNHSRVSDDASDESLTNTSFGVNLGLPIFSMGIGYGVSEQLVIGGSVVFNHATGSAAGLADTSGTVFSISPYLNYVMGSSTDSVRPFVGAALNYSLISGDGDSAWSFGGGPQTGIHIFLNDAVSLDLTGRVLAAFGSFEEANTFALDVSGFIGLSGWL